MRKAPEFLDGIITFIPPIRISCQRVRRRGSEGEDELIVQREGGGGKEMWRMRGEKRIIFYQ